MSYFRDLDLSLTIHPLSGDISDKVDENAIKRSLRHLFLIERWDIPFEPEKTSTVKELLFEVPSAITAAMLEKKITWFIKSVEPRIVLNSVKVSLLNNENGYNIDVNYDIDDLNLVDTYTHLLKRNFV